MSYNNLREIRKTNGIMPSFVANKLGVCYRHFARIEVGEATLTKERAEKLSSLYNVDINTIITTFERSVLLNDEKEKNRGRRKTNY